MSRTRSETDIRRSILHDTDHIPPLPEVVVKVISMLNECEVEPKELEEVLGCDQVLVARMLAMVNSPFFGFWREIRTIKEAITILGYQNLRSLVMVTSTAKFMKQDYGCYGYEAKGLWKHALCVGAAAKEIATHLGDEPILREELYVAALLHDIGKMVLRAHLSETTLPLGGSPEDLVEAESQALGIDHCEAGSLVAAKWNLSLLVQTVLNCHHGGGEDTEYARFISIVRLADSVAHKAGTGYGRDHVPKAMVRLEDLDNVGLPDDEWENLQEKLRESMRIAISSMSSVA